MPITNLSQAVPVASVIPNPNQPRRGFDEQSIQELADSIRENDLLQPIVVEDNLDGTFTLVGGERRLRAFQLLGRASIPANVRERSNHGGRELLLHAVIENVQREDMSPLDEAEAYQRMHDEFGMTGIDIGLRIGKHVTRISQLTTLLKLDPEIIELIRAKKLSHLYEVARALLRIPDSKARIKVAQHISTARLTIEQAVSLADRTALTLGAIKIETGKAKSPAMHLAQRKSRQVFDEDNAPNGWNALKQTGKVPAWSAVTESVTKSCQACALAAMANESICGECPLVDFLMLLMGGRHA